MAEVKQDYGVNERRCHVQRLDKERQVMIYLLTNKYCQSDIIIRDTSHHNIKNENKELFVAAGRHFKNRDLSHDPHL